MNSWSEVVGQMCESCNRVLATHIYGGKAICCECHGGNYVDWLQAVGGHIDALVSIPEDDLPRVVSESPAMLINIAHVATRGLIAKYREQCGEEHSELE